MLARQRQAMILDRVRESGAVRVADLARDLGVSDMTVRRDLEILHEHGLLEKVHGGATLISGFASYEPGFVAKSALQQDEKQAIAAAAAALVEPGMAIAISAGTTTHALAARVAEIPGVTVVTNSLRVADVLYRSGRRDQTVILTGGVRTPSEALVGSVRRRPAPIGPPGPRVHGRARHGRARRVSPARTCPRRRPTGRSSRRAGGSSSSPTTASGGSSGSHRSRGSTRRTSSSRTATWIRRGSSCSARPCASSSSWTWTTPRSSTSPRSRCRCGASPLRGRGRVPTDHRSRPQDATVAALEPEPHRRFNALTGEWVLVSAGRTERPWLGAEEPEPPEDRPAYDPDCYLCPGNVRVNGAVNPSYDATFVFTNDFAALRPDTSDARIAEGLFRAEGTRGTCRVVCFSPRHDLTLAGMTEPEIRRIVDVWAEETTELGERYRWVQVFENRGEAMGASNPHPHGQIWSGDALPVEAQREDEAQARYLAETGRGAAGRLRGGGARRPADGGDGAGLAHRRAVLGGLAVRDAADPAAAGGAPGRPRRRRARRARDRPPRPHPSV